MDLILYVWRQEDTKSKGKLARYEAKGISKEGSFLEMLDQVNEELMQEGKDPIAFDHDCREGICGACSMVINGQPQGQLSGTTVCQLHMRYFKDGDAIYIEPFRTRAFPVIKDLVVDRSALDRIIQAGGAISATVGSAPEAHSHLIPKDVAKRAMDAAECIGCGACVAACPNGSAMLFVGAKVSHLAELLQGKQEGKHRIQSLVAAMDQEGFGHCSNHYECTTVCPKGITKDVIARAQREFLHCFSSK